MSDQRLPLPGERPAGVWRPRQRQAGNPWLRLHPHPLWRLIPWVLGAVLLLLGLGAWRATAIPVTIVRNGEPFHLRLHRATVGGAVRAAGIRPDDTIYLDPPAETRLEAGMVITVAYRRPVIVHVDGQTRLGSSHQTDPAAIAADLGITLGPADRLTVNRAVRPSQAEVGSNPALAGIPALPREISVIRAAPVIVDQDGGQVAFESSAPTLGMALAAAGYELYEADQLSPSPGVALPPGGLNVTLRRALPAAVRADGQTRIVRTQQATVGDLLDELGLALTGADYAVPDLAARLEAGQIVRVVRVREVLALEEAPIPFEMVYVPDPDLELDQQQVVQEGREGRLASQVRIRTEDGVEVSRVVEAEWVAVQPAARVVGYGTRIVIRTVRTERGDLRYYWRTLRVLATSYSPATAGYKPPDDPYFGLSATGDVVQRGIVAVDPRVIPLYTYLYVPGYGSGRALDIGNAVKGRRIDLGYSDEHLVLWNNWVDIYLLVPVPPPDEMIWVLPD